MYEPQLEPRPIITVPESRLNYPAMKTLITFLHQYKVMLKFKTPTILYPERFVQAYKDFVDDKNRLILAFRHPYGDDPQHMIFVIHISLPKAAKKLKIKLPNFVHAHFLYGVEVPMWSGAFVRWLFPQVGAVPVNHTKMDAKGMNRIRKLVTEGTYPIALAPEGHVTYGSERVLELESGTARFGFWAMEDLDRQNQDKKVAVLPISLHYRYGKKAPKQLAKMLTQLEKTCGIETEKQIQKEISNASFTSRLSTIGNSILDHLAAYYAKTIGELEDGHSVLPVTEHNDLQRSIFEACLRTAERILGIVPLQEATSVARIYQIRTMAWDLIFRDDIQDMTPLQYEISCKETGFAWFAMRHIELAEILNYVDCSKISENLELEQLIEIANNFYDIIERIKGGVVSNRANIFTKYSVAIPATPIIVDTYKEDYKKDKKATIQALTDEIRGRFLNCIEEYNEMYRPSNS